MLIGCARESTSDQTIDLQKDVLSEEGCERTVPVLHKNRIPTGQYRSYVPIGPTIIFCGVG